MLSVDYRKLAALNRSDDDGSKLGPIKILGDLYDIDGSPSPDFTLVFGVHDQKLDCNPLQDWRWSRCERLSWRTKALAVEWLEHDGLPLGRAMIRTSPSVSIL